MSKKEVDRLNGDLKRLEDIQRVLLSTHAGVVPDGYVNVLVEEIKWLWGKSATTIVLEEPEGIVKGTTRDMPDGEAGIAWKADPKNPRAKPTLREQSNKFIPHKNPSAKKTGGKEAWNA